MRRFKLVATFTLAIIVIGASAYLLIYLYVLRPVITISGNAAQVSLYQNQSLVQQSRTSKSFRVSSGTYTVSTTLLNGGVVNQTLTVGPLKKQTIVTPASAAKPQSSSLMLVASALEAVKDSSSIRYLDTTNNAFVSNSDNGQQQSILPATIINSYANTDYGTIFNQVSPLPNGAELLVAGNGTPYAWANGQALKLSTTGLDNTDLSQNQVLVASNALNDDFVMSVDTSVYYYSSISASPQKIATLQSRFNRLVYGGGKFLAFDTTLPYTNAGFRKIYAEKYLVNPVLADISSKRSSQLNSSLVDASISPDGTYLAAKYRQEDAASLYKIDGGQTSLYRQMTRPDVLAPIWLTNSTFAYASIGAIWNYDIATGVSTQLTATGRSPSSIALQPDKSLTYTTLSGAGQGGVYAVGTKTTTLSTGDIKKLYDFLSKTSGVSDAYSVAYNAIEKPTFTLNLVYPAGGSNPTPAQAIQSFQTELRNAKLDPNQFTINVSG